MKYKVGDEVLVKARIINGTRRYFGVEIEDNRFDVCEDDIVPVPETTADEAWEIAKKILLYPDHGGFNATELEEIFGRTEHLWELTPQEAKAKIEAWEAEKEIKVGDEVAPKRDPNSNECKFVVTKKDDKDGIISGFSVFGGDVFSGRDIKLYQKTGRHIDIDGVLKQIGGDK